MGSSITPGFDSLARLRLLGMGTILALAACGPPSEVETEGGSTSLGTTSGGSSSSSSSGADGTTTGSDLPEPGTTGGLEPCPDGERDLSPMWLVTDPNQRDGVAVALGAEVVAWVASGSGDANLRLLDTRGHELWSESAPSMHSMGALTLSDVAFGDDGTIILGTTLSVGLQDIEVRWYDDTGMLLQEGSWLDPGQDILHGTAALGDADAILVGHSMDELFVARYDLADAGMPTWTAFVGEARWASDVVVTPSGGLIVSGFPGPVVVAFSPDGMQQWAYTYEPPENPQATELPGGLTLDPEGRPVLAIETDTELVPYAGHVDRLEIGGGPPTTLVELDFIPLDARYDADGRLVVAGSRPGQNNIYVRRYEPDGTMASQYVRDGRWAHDIEVDRDCHVYLAGTDDDDGAFLEKLW